MNLGSATWRDIGTPVLAVPLGATEQHGPHLPLDTDTTIALALARRLAERVVDMVVAPPLPYGSSGEHAGFAGTLSIGRDALRHVLLELGRSADRFDGVVFVNGHGGNLAPLRDAVRILRDERRRVLAWSPSGSADDTHAGHTETSVMLRLRPSEVRLEAVEPGPTVPIAELLDRLIHGGVREVSPNGVLGDPTGASAEAGERVLTTWTDSLVRAVNTWRRACWPSA